MNTRKNKGPLIRRDPKNEGPIGAMFEFWKDGRTLRLRNVYLVADNSGDEALLKSTLSKLINPIHLERMRRLIRLAGLD